MAKPAEAEAEAPAPKSKKKLIIIIVAAVALIGAGGAGWFFMKDKSKEGGAGAEPPKAEVQADPKFISLESFTVNLQHEEGAEADQYLQINIALKIVDSDLEDKVKAVLPEIRSKINLLLSSKRASEIVTIVGKKKLALDIVNEANTVLGFHHAHSTAPAAASAVVAEGAIPTDEAASAPVPVAGEAAANPEPGAEPQEKAESQEKPAAPVKEEKKGVVDVLFTSFLIQ